MRFLFFFIFLFFSLISKNVFANANTDILSVYENSSIYLVGLATKQTNVFLTDLTSIEKLEVSNNYFLQQIATKFYTNDLYKGYFSHLALTPDYIIAGNMLRTTQLTNYIYILKHNLDEMFRCPITESVNSIAPLNNEASEMVIIHKNGKLVLAFRNENQISNIFTTNVFFNSKTSRDFYDIIYVENTIYLANTYNNSIETFIITNNILMSSGCFSKNLNKPDSIFYDSIEDIFWVTEGGFLREPTQISTFRRDGSLIFRYFQNTFTNDLSKVSHIGNGILINACFRKVLVTQIRALISPSNSILDATSTGNTNNLIDLGEDFNLKLALENWCWTNINPTATINVEKTIATNSLPETDILTNWFSLPQTTGYFPEISHREIGWQTNSFPFFMPTNPQLEEIILVFDVAAPPAPSNFTVATTIKLNNPNGVYSPTSLFFNTTHSVATNFPVVITNIGTRTLTSVCTNNSTASWWTFNPTTNNVPAGAAVTAFLSIDTSLLPATDGYYSAALLFDENNFPLWNPTTSNYYDNDGATLPFTIIASENQPPVWLYPTNYSKSEWTGTSFIHLDVTDDFTHSAWIDYELLESPTNVVLSGSSLEWTADLNLVKRGETGKFTFAVAATDNGIPPLSTTQNFIVTVYHINGRCFIYTRFNSGDDPFYIDAGIPWQGLIEINDFNEEDIPYLTMGVSNLPSVMTFEKTTNYNNFYWLGLPNPIEGDEFSNIFFYGSDNYEPNPQYAEKECPTLIVVPEPLFLFFLYFSIIYFFLKK